MKVHLGVLFISIIIKFNHAKEVDIEQDGTERFGSTMLQKYENNTSSHMVTITSNTSSEEFRMRSRRQLNQDSCGGCGIANFEKTIRTSIINGDVVRPPYKYPWTVPIRVRGAISCTGSIISEYFVLSAAHCFKLNFDKYEALKPTNTRVPYMSPSVVSIDIWKRRGLPVERIIPHPEFSISQWRHDIALLQLTEKIFCNKYARPVCLPPPEFALPRQALLIIAGYGSNTPGRKTTLDYLQEAKVNQVGYNVCHFPNHMKDGTYYCLKGLNYRNKGTQAACFGDSGGPMIYQDGSKFYQFGIASFGKQCNVNEAFLYTSVPRHLNWIYRNMGSLRESAYLSGTGAGVGLSAAGAGPSATGAGLSAAGRIEHNKKVGGWVRTEVSRGSEVGHEGSEDFRERIGGCKATAVRQSRSRYRKQLEAHRFAEDGYVSKTSPTAGRSGRVKQ